MNKDNLNEFEQFLKGFLSVPAPEDDFFLKSWGLEQWLIKNCKMDFEQARIKLSEQFAFWTLRKVTRANSREALEKWIGRNECRLVRARENWTRFPFRKVYKGMVGILLFERIGQFFCIFPLLKSNILDKQYFGWVEPGRVDVLAEIFESNQQVIGMCEIDLA